MELSELRKKIDRIDEELLALFLERMQLSGEIAEYKREHGLPVYNAGREQEILDWVARESGNMEKYAVPFFKSIFVLSRSRQEQILSDDFLRTNQED